MLTLVDESARGAHHLAAPARPHARLLEALREEGPGRLRRARARLQAQPQRPARGRRARAAAQARGAPRAPRRAGRALRRGARRASRASRRSVAGSGRRACTAGTSTSCASRREGAGADRDAYAEALGEEGIGTGLHFLPVHDLTYFRASHPTAPLPVAEQAGAEVLSLPLSPAHSLCRRRRRHRGRAPPARALHAMTRLDPVLKTRLARVALQVGAVGRPDRGRALAGRPAPHRQRAARLEPGLVRRRDRASTSSPRR